MQRQRSAFAIAAVMAAALALPAAGAAETPTDDAPAAVAEAPAPADEAAITVDEAPADEAAITVDEAPAPVDDAAIPADDAAAPVDDAAIPADVAPAPPDDMIGELRLIVAAYQDTLLDIARDNGLGYVEMIAANRDIDPWVPGKSTRVVLPTAHILPDAAREGLVVNLGEHRLYYFDTPGGDPVTFPLGVGMEGWSTPLGTTEIVRKKVRPTWYPPESIRAKKPELPKVVPPGPNNPLGSHALYFDWPSYLIHGTNRPWGIGRRISHGCIRLYPEDIAQLYEIVDVGTPVQVIDQAIKIGWSGGELFMEAHPEGRQADELETTGQIESRGGESLADALYRIKTRAGAAQDRLDWRLIRDALEERSGIPVRITVDRPATPG